MTDSRLKIAVVAGRVTNLHRFDAIAKLAATHELTVLSLDVGKTLANYQTEFRHVIFEEKADMPGYMQGLETHLEGHDLIIAYETFQLSSFQACRAAQKSKIPFWIIADDYKPFRYIDFKNIRAIQSDIAQHHTRILTSTNAAAKALAQEGMKPELFTHVPVGIEIPMPAEMMRLRQKFRKYIGIPDNRIVMTYEGQLVESDAVTNLVKAMKLALEIKPELRTSLTLLVIGDGPQQREIKCQTYDAGLNRNILFIHQDTSKITADIFSSSDIFIAQPIDEGQPYFAPVRALTAGVWGALPLLGRDPVNAEVFTNQNCFVDDY